MLLAHASARLWHGRHEKVGPLLVQALADAVRDGQPGLELEVLATMALADSYWSRTSHADDAAQRAHALDKRLNLAVPAALELAVALRSLLAGDLGGRARVLQQILVPDAVGSDPGLAAAVALAQASVLLAAGQETQAWMMLKEAGRRIPSGLAVLRDIMLADLDTSQGRPRAALRLLACYRGSDFAVLTAKSRARAHLALGDLCSARDCVRSVLAIPRPRAAVTRL